jgi:hypothetical protein
MNISKAEAHSRAVVAIQALLSKHHPGTNSHRIAELALDLAFNGSTPSNADFESELLAHARLLIRGQIAARLRSRTNSAPRSRNFPTFDVHPLSMRRFALHRFPAASTNVVEASVSATGARNVHRG